MNKRILIIAVSFVVAIVQSSMGQGLKNTYEVKSGWGLRQGYNIGLNYYCTDKHDIGVGLGSYFNSPPLENKDHFSVQVENTLHFGSETIQHVGGWFFNQQLIYIEEGRHQRWKILMLGLNLGKTIGISPKLGINLEAGPTFNAAVGVQHDPMDEVVGWVTPILLNGRIQLTYKFN